MMHTFIQKINKTSAKFLSAILAVLAIAFVTLVTAPVAYANEGRVDLSTGSISCEGVSVWESDRYHIVGRCQGLVYPYAERLDRYMLWVKPEDGGNPVRVEEVERGLFDAQTDVRFAGIMITAEEDISPRQPGTTIVVSGDIARFDFAANTSVTAPNQPTPTQAPVISVTPSAPKSSVQGINFGSNAVMNLVLIGVLAAVVIWILFFLRR